MKQHLKTTFQHALGMKRRIDRANLSLVAAGGAFFAMLSLFPGLAAVIALLGFLARPETVQEGLILLQDFMPPDAFALIETQVTRLVRTNSSTLGWATAISTLAALWSARRGTDAVIKAVNTVYDAPIRGGVRAAGVAVMITLALILVVTVAILTMLVLPVVVAFLPLGPYTGFALEVARWLIALAVVLSGIWVLYRFAPNCAGAKVRWLNPGAVLTVLVWAAGSWAFTYYLANFGNYNQIYGSIGAVIALLMFLYITIFVVLLGATLNAELFRTRQAEAEGETATGAVSGDTAAGSGSGLRDAASVAAASTGL
jgi:membrane protein